jgi:HD-like signal output (HDOD) protein
MGLFGNHKKESKRDPVTTTINLISKEDIEAAAPNWYKKYKTLKGSEPIAVVDSFSPVIISADLRDSLKDYVKEIMPEPSASFKIYQKLNNEETSIQEVSTLVATDPLLAAKVLKTVNSASYGFTTEILELGRAVTLIGFQGVKYLVLSQSMQDSMQGTEEEIEFNQKIRTHSSMVSAIAQHLSAGVEDVKAGDAATLGLLHDIGKILYLKIENSGKKIESKQDIPKIVFEAIIASVFAELWELPSSIITTLEYLPYPLFYPKNSLISLEQCSLITVVQAANCIANSIEVDDGDNLYSIHYEYLTHASISDDLAELIDPSMVSAIEKSRSALL